MLWRSATACNGGLEVRVVAGNAQDARASRRGFAQDRLIPADEHPTALLADQSQHHRGFHGEIILSERLAVDDEVMHPGAQIPTAWS